MPPAPGDNRCSGSGSGSVGLCSRAPLPTPAAEGIVTVVQFEEVACFPVGEGIFFLCSRAGDGEPFTSGHPPSASSSEDDHDGTPVIPAPLLPGEMPPPEPVGEVASASAAGALPVAALPTVAGDSPKPQR